jgi:hypothetical protein
MYIGNRIIRQNGKECRGSPEIPTFVWLLSGQHKTYWLRGSSDLQKDVRGVCEGLLIGCRPNDCISHPHTLFRCHLFSLTTTELVPFISADDLFTQKFSASHFKLV